MAVLSKPVRTHATSRQRLLHLPREFDILEAQFKEETLSLLKRFEILTKWRLLDWLAQGVDSGHDLFVKAGTGAGKSMIFLAMIEAILNGIVLVLCLLLSLMHDQVHIQTLMR
jgi:hypothetical protein